MANTKQQAPMTSVTLNNDQMWLPPPEENFQLELPLLSLDIPNVTQLDDLEEDKVTNLSHCFPENDCSGFEDHLSASLILPSGEKQVRGKEITRLR